MLLGDVNNDGYVDASDCDSMKTYLNKPSLNTNSRYDVNTDGVINAFDLLATRGQFGKSTKPA